MADLDLAIAAARKAMETKVHSLSDGEYILASRSRALRDLLAALDAARGEAVWQVSLPKSPECWSDYDSETTANAVAKASGNKCREVRAVYLAPPAALAVPANVTPMRQPRADLARLVESINTAVYANGSGLSVTEAIGALELAKLELLKEQEQ